MNNEIKGEFHITKLSDTNYQSWKTEMCWYLRGKNLLDYVLTEKRPDQNATENEVRAHRMNENKAFAAIGLHVEADQQIHIEDCANAHEAWETLKQVHQPKSRVRIMKLKKEFYHLRMKDEEGMSAYVSRVKVATRNLREAGAEVKDEDLAYAMLAGLPDSYENLNMALASLSDDKFTSAEVKRVLLEEYDRRISRLDRTTEHFKEALYVNKKTEKNESKPSGNNFKQLRTCFNCNKVGHIARDCRIRINKDKRKQETRYKRDNDAFLISLNNVDLENSWLLDSGCTHHVCKRREWFANFRHINSEVVNTAADPVKQKGITLKAQGIGNIRLNMIVGNRKKTVVLHDVYYVPNIRRNLMSVSQIEQKGKELLIKNGKVKIRNVITKNIVGEAYRKNDLYIVKTEVCTNTSFPVESHNASMEMNQLWHRRFCHVSNDTIKKLIETNRVTGLDNAKTNKYICDACNIAKATRVASKRLNIKQTKETCELIHSDVCGPMPEKSIGGSRYFITFTDDFSRYTTVVCIKSKDEVKRCIKEYIAKVEREKGKKVKRFRTDNGLEFCNQELNEFFKNLGIKHESLSNRNTWEVTELPKGRKCIGCKWVFKLKTNTEGKITRYKARLVAQGFSQKKGVDYSETYSPVANFSLIRLFLALAVIFKWHTRHVDIKCAYLYGTLKEEIYMKLPPLYNAKEGMVAKLLRPIYGLKQSGRNWNEELDVYLTGQGFKRMQSSSCVYKREDGTILIIYVDDIFIFAPDSKLVTDTVRRITEKYEAKDLGEINQALGVKVERNNAGNIYLSQRLYIEEMLKKYNMTECRKVTTPLDPSLRISKEDAPTTDTERSYMANVPYRGLIGGLMFLALYTRPDILFAVTKLSQYNSNPGRKHWQQAKHILRYLSATKDYGIVYKTNIKPKFEIYCDADWACDPDDRHSFSGMVMLFGGNIVKWRTVKQKSLSTSTMEAEYVSLANGVKEAMWLNMFMSELGLIDYVSDSLQINCDNQAAIDFAKNRMEKNRTKHIDIAYHIVRENLEKGLIHLTYVPSNENLADGMTKGLKKIVHDRYVKNIGMGVTKWGN
ncbi:Retrovirus-related Pol polyprotein from transposon TNT 1-94 [Anthophora quadrimaculata]